MEWKAKIAAESCTKVDHLLALLDGLVAKGAEEGSAAESSTKEDFEAFQKVLTDSSTSIENEVNKLVLGWPSMRTETEANSLMDSFLKRVEMIVTCSYLVFSNPNVCCNAARKESSVTVYRLLSSVKNVLEYLKSEGPEDQGPPLVGSVWEACKAVRLTPKTNYAAVKRCTMRHAITVKDIHTEFTQVSEQGMRRQQNTDEQGDEGEAAVGGAEDEPAVGSDEWYEMMDSLQEDDSMDEDEVIRLESVLQFIAMAGRSLQQAALIAGGTPEWYKNADLQGQVQEVEVARYMEWLNGITSNAEQVEAATNALGMRLYPPHDPEMVKNALEELRGKVSVLIETVRQASEHIPPEMLERTSNLANAVESFTME